MWASLCSTAQCMLYLHLSVQTKNCCHKSSADQGEVVSNWHCCCCSASSDSCGQQEGCETDGQTSSSSTPSSSFLPPALVGWQWCEALLSATARDVLLLRSYPEVLLSRQAVLSGARCTVTPWLKLLYTEMVWRFIWLSSLNCRGKNFLPIACSCNYFFVAFPGHYLKEFGNSTLLPPPKKRCNSS